MVQADDFNVSRELLNGGEYDWIQVEWLSKLVGPESRLVFAGAHIGAMLVPLVRATGSPHVLAYEPSPANFRLLQMNLALNDLRHVVTVNSALGDHGGSVRFTEKRINSGNSPVCRARGAIDVPLDTLDSRIPADWTQIDLIVMDIEGSEAAAMRGARATLARTRYLYVEFAPEQLREQSSNAAEFVAEAARHFQSAYIFGTPVRFLGPAQFADYLCACERQRGLLLNVLFTHDREPCR